MRPPIIVDWTLSNLTLEYKDFMFNKMEKKVEPCTSKLTVYRIHQSGFWLPGLNRCYF